MIVRFDKSFEKDLKKFRDKRLISEILKQIDHIKNAESINQIVGLKKLTGFKSYYRIRIGDYRVGVFLNGDVIELIRFLHRKDIYKSFP